MIGAVGLAVGAIIAAALPSTPQEDKLLGPAADDLKRKAGDVALEGVAAAKEVATEDLPGRLRAARKSKVFPWTTRRNSPGQVGEKIKTAVANVTGDKQQAGDPENSPRPLPARPASGRTT